jgi:hypothetical protein
MHDHASEASKILTNNNLVVIKGDEGDVIYEIMNAPGGAYKRIFDGSRENQLPNRKQILKNKLDNMEGEIVDLIDFPSVKKY